ncbi:hypothetical protein MPTK1_8g15210 [Marchantia polymorpha subsp. ruderalis]|uniref:Uncharacterized protein n=1 Tax=Marchantia polymorpha TaxID=3197 RepID=A0A2R6W1H3_MARPO|nr:hypothetical protein MARPO_0187s0008 [Marchantia polymorpha]BBN19956.1 hypothetical protein Mp_8g15210 [Marchantia polymorpha subsp. ruderalis]|eukprot:PTQ27685.1 hypothetical protein MARPO_0187s0008 [Marchantia polymorpha]
MILAIWVIRVWSREVGRCEGCTTTTAPRDSFFRPGGAPLLSRRHGGRYAIHCRRGDDARVGVHFLQPTRHDTSRNDGHEISTVSQLSRLPPSLPASLPIDSHRARPDSRTAMRNSLGQGIHLTNAPARSTESQWMIPNMILNRGCGRRPQLLSRHDGEERAELCIPLVLVVCLARLQWSSIISRTPK